MNRYINALRSVGNGFLPVSQIKTSFVVVIVLYLVFLTYHIKDNLDMERQIRVENEQKGGALMLNSVKYPIVDSQINALVSIKINNAAEFLFLSDGAIDESFVSALVKIITCVLALRLLWYIDITDPFNTKYYKQINTITWFAVLIILLAYFKGFYTEHWFNDAYHSTSGFKYDWGFGPFYLIPVVWLLRAISAFYRSAVKNRQEVEFTI